MAETTRYLLRSCLPLGVLAGVAAFFAARIGSQSALEAQTAALHHRALAYAVAGAASLDPLLLNELVVDLGAGYEEQWMFLRRSAANLDSAGGLKNSEILAYRGGNDGLLSVYAPEGNRFRRPQRPLPLVERALQSRKAQVGEASNGKIEAAAPVLDREGGVAGAVWVRLEAEDFEAKSAQLGMAPLVALLSAFLVVALAALAMRPKHTADLKRLEDELESLGETSGLQARLDARPMSFTEGVASRFNAILDRVQQMVSSVKKGADLVSGSSQRVSMTATEVSRMANEMATTIQQVAKGTEDQSARTSELHTIIQQVSDSAQSNRRKAEETAAASEGASEIAQTIHDLAQDAVSQMEKLSKDIRNTAEVIYNLGDKSERIGEVVDIIRSIADQTNLLALNAAIEAARAGDAGRGFAVVADEVRKLAEGSAASADQIASMIGEIQRSTQDAVSSMQKGSEGVSEGSEVISRVGSGLNQIIEAVRRTSQLAADISGAAREQTTRANAGAQRIEEINAIAEETAASTQEVAASTQEATASMEELSATSAQLAEMARELQGLVSKFDMRS